MHQTRFGPTRWRVVATVPVFALVATGLTIAGASAASDDSVARYIPSPSDHYINYAEPKPELRQSEVQLGTAEDGTPIYGSVVDDLTAAYDAKYSAGNPVAGRVLAKHEQLAIKTGKNPRDFRYKRARDTQVAKLLTILVEFNDQANDDFTGVHIPIATFDDDVTPENERDCVLAEEHPTLSPIQNGPLHNNIPNPAEASHDDNNSMWIPDFSPEFYNDILYSKEGYTERVRPDLTGPDGKPGISLRGYTMRNMYEEMSKGRYSVDGEATPWITVPHSEAWYAANTCVEVEPGVWSAGPSQSMNGHPDNPQGASTLGIDAVNALAAADPNFPWADYDIEDVSDADGDGNLLEPDGVIDHLVLVHAGEDKSGGGGAEGPYAIWAHSSDIPGGYLIPGTNLRVSNYIVQPEDSGVGVFAHEYGHDLGLPDLYDIASGGDSDIDFWDLMASGSHSGPVFQSIPTNMGLWDKWVLGWAEPKTFEWGDRAKTVVLGQTSNTPRGTADGIRVVLPDKVITRAVPHSGANMWYSSNDQSWADVRLTREIQVPTGSDVRFWSWNNYTIEQDWDFGFIEVSTDGGNTFEEQKVWNEDGTLASTDDGYPDPNGRMTDYGGKKYGIHGSTGGAWEHYYVDLTPFAGQTIQLRLRLATDAAFQAGGWFADDFEVTADGTTVWSDDVESGNQGWTPVVSTFTDTTGTGWVIDSGTSVQAQYYLAEWRNFDGFDEGLKYTYDSTYLRDGAWKVERVKYNAPGMLVWYRDTTYGDLNLTLNNLFDGPSGGTKGGLLIVDSHFDPLRRAGEGAAKDPSVLKNIPSRPQSSNAAFTLHKTYPFTECLEAPGEPFSEYCTEFGRQKAVSTFTDSLGWYPGIENRAEGLFFRDADASVVIPSRDIAPYSTRVVNADGSPALDWYGVDIGFAAPLGTGNPADDGVQFGVKFQLLFEIWNHEWAIVRVTPGR